ncbi:hypothetical protein T4C_11708 [Trichinella pseudospiralis]|uniref:Uncharacterized protein n=1 Tax=Trichinella pseudospiralis TaxID=6337 RepID=A0A0V1J7I0_TRIPS|nr:hypothetical protein T4D_11451 [Trichinella pseudospiralis]KRZ30912.1 hypothetical protein T4C_12873 [Trichinella pseudospiralis]KRZ30977.1 hypothetical protein T4C_11708 [Trichinella pseudospiralis]
MRDFNGDIYSKTKKSRYDKTLKSGCWIWGRSKQLVTNPITVDEQLENQKTKLALKAKQKNQQRLYVLMIVLFLVFSVQYLRM